MRQMVDSMYGIVWLSDLLSTLWQHCSTSVGGKGPDPLQVVPIKNALDNVYIVAGNAWLPVDLTVHFIVGTSRLPYAITMLANYYLDSPYVWCGQIIQAKKKCSHRYWQICEQYLREIFDVCVFVYICKKTFLKPPKTQLFEFSSWATWAKTKDCNYIFVQCTSLFWPNNKNKILKHIKHLHTHK